jgi:DNA-binding MarR family transcriptional regulator
MRSSAFDVHRNSTQEESRPRDIVGPSDVGALAEALYRLRRRRDRSFGGALFSEPSWDLLLELLAAEKSGSHVSIKTACLAAAVPNTTAVRCLRQLERRGVVYRQPDRRDRRRINIRLTEPAASMMETLFGDLCHCFTSLLEATVEIASRVPENRDSPPNLDADSGPTSLGDQSSDWCLEDADEAKKGKEMHGLSGIGVSAIDELSMTEIAEVSGGVTAAGFWTGVAIVGGVALTVGVAALAAPEIAAAYGISVGAAELMTAAGIGTTAGGAAGVALNS